MCREITEIFTGLFPTTRVLSRCRCPPGFPRENPQLTTMCVKNSAVLNSTDYDTVSRLNVNAHPLEFANDGDINSAWISSPLTFVAVTIDLGDIYEVGSLRHYHARGSHANLLLSPRNASLGILTHF